MSPRGPNQPPITNPTAAPPLEPADKVLSTASDWADTVSRTASDRDAGAHLTGGSPNGKAADFGSADQGSIPCPSAISEPPLIDAEVVDRDFQDDLESALGPLAPRDGGQPLGADELALREAIWANLRDLNIEDSGLDLTGLSNITPGQIEETDHARLARLAYGMGYIRLLEFLARKPPHWAGNMEQAKLAFAYVKHVETNDRDVLRLNQRTQGDANLDRALVQMQREVVRIALIKEKITRTKEPESATG